MRIAFLLLLIDLKCAFDSALGVCFVVFTILYVRNTLVEHFGHAINATSCLKRWLRRAKVERQRTRSALSTGDEKVFDIERQPETARHEPNPADGYDRIATRARLDRIGVYRLDCCDIVRDAVVSHAAKHILAIRTQIDLAVQKRRVR